jgi:hypothetical protein
MYSDNHLPKRCLKKMDELQWLRNVTETREWLFIVK